MSKTLDDVMKGLPLARRKKIEQRSAELIHMAQQRATFISHHEATIAQLAQDKAFAQVYLIAAFEKLGEPEALPVVVLALRDVAEAYGGLATVAQKAAVSQEELNRALSPGGDPTLNIVIAILYLVGMCPSLATA